MIPTSAKNKAPPERTLDERDAGGRMSVPGLGRVKTIRRRRSHSSKTASALKRANGFNFESELKNVILAVFRSLAFLHSQGHFRKSAQVNDMVRSNAVSGRRCPGPASPKSADIVAKVFLGGRTKFLRAADAFYERRREGPYRFIQNRPGTSIVALKSVTAAEESKDQLSRDFSGRSIFDFCNNIGTKRTCRANLTMSVDGGKTDLTLGCTEV
jgi:hypothetical protein